MNKKTLEAQFDKQFVYEDTIHIGGDRLKQLKQFWFVSIHEVLEEYTSWLAKHQYTDSDTYAEEPKAVDRFLKEFNK